MADIIVNVNNSTDINLTVTESAVINAVVTESQEIAVVTVGEQGPEGQQGPEGPASTVPDPQGDKGDKGDKGDQGDPATNLVTSVAGKQGVVVLTSADVGLGNVDNTSDANKPISSATATALSGKEPTIATKGSAFNKDFGTTNGTVTQGDDARLSNARTPTAHQSTHRSGGSDSLFPIDKIVYQTAPTIPSHSEGTSYWDADNHTIAVHIAPDITMQIGQENHIRVCNKTAGSNTAAPFTGLGGQFAINATVAADTDLNVIKYLVPIGNTLIIRGAWIDTANTVVAVATTATLLQWGIAVGSSADTLAGTEDAVGVKIRRAIPMGLQFLPVGAVVGQTFPRLDVNFDAPLVIHGGEYVSFFFKVLVGTATATEVYRGVIGVNGYFE